MNEIEIEYWKPALDELASFLLVQQKENEVVKQIQLLSEAFNARNDLLKNYFHSKEFVSSYSQFFLPTNIPKLTFLLKQIPHLYDYFNRESFQFIDFGCGPGTYSLAWLKHFPDSEVILLDHSETMIKQATQLVEGLFDKKNIAQSIDPEKKQILFFGNVINEMSESQIKAIIKKYQSDVVIFIEPGTAEVFKSLLKVRSGLIESGFDCHFPCPSLAQCPLKESKEDWCHQVLRRTHALDVERLCQLAKKDRKIMPMNAHVYVRPNLIQKQENQFQMTRFLKESKHSFEYEACVNDGDELGIKKIVLPKKQITKDKLKALKKGSVGERLNLEVLKTTEQEIRAKI